MKNGLIFCSILVALMLQSCGKKATEPEKLAEFSGITYTDETGTVNGPEDKEDWKMVLFSGDPSKDTVSVINTGGVPNPVPLEFAFDPAYPNPASNGVINFRFTIKVPSSIYLYVYDKPGHIADTLINKQQLVPGRYMYSYNNKNFTDKQIMRALLEITSENGNIYKSYGDFQLIK